MDPFHAYAAFVRTFEAGSFSAVARELGTTQSAVSKQIAALEKSLAVQLFARTTRRLQPTAEALLLYQHARQMLDTVESLRSVSSGGAPIAGTLRVTMPGAYGRHRVCHLLPGFLERYPDVRLELDLNDQAVDLIEERFELGIRVGDLQASTLMARQVEAIELVTVASPAYLARHGRPESPVELSVHACLALGSGAEETRWEFESELGRQAVDVAGPLRANDPDVVHTLVRAGAGIGVLPQWLVQDDVQAARLVALMPDFYPLALKVSVVYPQTRFLSLRARAFIDYLIDACAALREQERARPFELQRRC